MSEPLLATEAEPTTEGQTEQVTADSSSAETTEQTQQEETTTEETTEETESEKPGAPESYEFQNPEGLPEVVDKEIHDAYSKAARELDLPQEQAQTLFTDTMDAIYKRATAQQEAQSQEWVEAAEKDSEYGGDKLDENLATAKKAVAEFGSDGLRDLLATPHGVGNNPELVRFLFRVGKAISEDRFVGGNEVRTVDPSDEAARARRMYPNSPS